MNTKLTLKNPTDDKLNRSFAINVCQWKLVRDMKDDGVLFQSPEGQTWMPDFVASADAVLPWLGKCQHFDHNWNCVHKEHWVWVKIDGRDKANGSAPTFPRAAVIALLRAHHVEVVT